MDVLIRVGLGLLLGMTILLFINAGLSFWEHARRELSLIRLNAALLSLIALMTAVGFAWRWA